MKSGKTLLIVLGVVLLAGIALQAIPMRNVKLGDVNSPARPIGLAEKIPAALDGWTVREEALGPNESVRSVVEKTLNYDDYVFRTYRRGATEFAVYIAYWSAGRMPMEKVASHTPDRCWSENGWTCTQMRFPEVWEAADGKLKPAYWRTFVPPGASAQTHVVYWHLVNGEPYDYGTGFNRRASPLKWWRDTLHYAWKGSGEQFFIRVTSNRPFEEVRREPGFAEVLNDLAKLGLAVEKAEADAEVKGEG
ncbi:MAG: EpsI family protein [Opitutus sp.]|nr:EpsI family protein [Opitutus sp.]